MSKSLLVIDTPNKCWDCPLHGESWDDDNEEIMICRGVYRESHYGEIPNWCPLKPLGKRIGDYGLEVWTSRVGLILQEKGLFERIYKDEEND